MRPTTLRCLGVTAAAAAAMWCWYLLKMKPESASWKEVKSPTQPTSVSGKPTPPKPAGPLPKFGTTEFHHMVRERGEKWLDSRGRDAPALLALLDVTGDETFLAEAAQKFPDDPRVCMASIEYSNDASAIPWIERLIAAEPGNPEGLFQKAWLLTSAGPTQTSKEDYEEAMVALRQAAALDGGRLDHIIERFETVRKAAVGWGVSPQDAARLSLAGPLTWRTASRVLIGAMSAIRWELAEAKAAGREDRVMEIIGIGVATADKFSGTPPITIADELTACRLKIALLADLPHDSEIGQGGVPVGSIRSGAEGWKTLLTQSAGRNAQVTALLETSTDDVLIAYFENFVTAGELYARSWLLEQAEKAK